MKMMRKFKRPQGMEPGITGIRNNMGRIEPTQSPISNRLDGIVSPQSPISNLKGSIEPPGSSISNLKGSIEPIQMPMQPIRNEITPLPLIMNLRRAFHRSQAQGFRVTRIEIEPFEFLNFLQWESIQTFNDHGVLRVSGLISSENVSVYDGMVGRDVWPCVKLWNDAGEERIFFHGILTSLLICTKHQVHTMTIEIKTGSFLLDQISHTRTFQDHTVSYQAVIDTCLNVAGGQFMMREKNETQIGQLTVQYKESDWSFIKRLAHRLGVVVLPEFVTQGKRFYLGINPNQRWSEMVSENYTMGQELSDANSLMQKENGVLYVHTRDVYDLGQRVSFAGSGFVVCHVKSFLEGGELVHDYTLSSLKSAYGFRQSFEQVQGVSMLAKVTNVARDRVQVMIYEDENKGRSAPRWFEYATVYSTPDGTGWYNMPEIGDEVRVIFPEAEDAGAYVASNVHLETTGGRVNPDHKSWKNRHGKEILLTPTGMHFTNNQGDSIDIIDNQGIFMKSNGNITLDSEADILLNSQSGVTVYGDRSVTVQQGAAQINIQNAINIGGGKINMN
ncbi:MAG: contractile injection system protein, VgrG/Pvc8 family [Lachnospiraceae bacterium]|nr:contractile injection system protein, VgrG/Pvc8 family [Lachnospiraceae bacterium]